MRELVTWAVRASRPVSWINTAFPFAAAYLLATRDIDAVLIVGTIFFLIPYNVTMYGVNDVFDYASDVANPRKDSIEGALVPPRLHRPLLWFIAAITVPWVVWLFAAGSASARLWLLVSVAAVLAYSVPVLRFKERPFLDSITSSTHFVSPAVVGFALAGADFTAEIVTILCAFFAWGMAAHAFGAVQDVVPDRAAGIGSIATVIGARWTVRLSIVWWALAGALMLTTSWPGPLAALIVVPYIINVWPYRNVSDSDSASSNTAWRRFIWLNYASGFVVTMLLIAAWR